MGQLKFNIDTVSDDQFFAVTEGLALAGQVMEVKGSGTLLVINLGSEGGNDGILSGSVDEQALAKLEELFEQLKERALEGPGEDAMVLHLEEQLDD